MLLLSAMVAGSAFAQGDSAGSKIKYGIKAGVNFANISVSDGNAPKSITSFHIGGLVDYALTEKITLQPGLILNGMGSKYEEGSFKSTTNLMYLQVE